MNNGYTNHSGGALGADTYWEQCGREYGVKTVAYSFGNHSSKSPSLRVLKLDELAEGWEAVKSVSKDIGRNLPYQKYVQNLLSRNWFQVKNSEAVFAISKLNRSTFKNVEGGTGWAVQMAIKHQKPVFLFDQLEKKWYIYNTESGLFTEIDYIPTLTQNFAGIGSRELTVSGMAAIDSVYKETFKDG